MGQRYGAALGVPFRASDVNCRKYEIKKVSLAWKWNNRTVNSRLCAGEENFHFCTRSEKSSTFFTIYEDGSGRKLIGIVNLNAEISLL